MCAVLVSMYSYTLLLLILLFSLSCALACRSKPRFSTCTSRQLLQPHSAAPLLHATDMKQLSADIKHAILLEYSPNDATRSFSALAARHGIKGGADVVRHWHDRWNHTPASLQHKAVSGRPRRLSRKEVQQHVRGPILLANKAHKVVHYSQLLPAVQQNTGKQLSARTLRRYGKEEVGAKQRRGKKRTADECECTHTREVPRVCV